MIVLNLETKNGSQRRIKAYLEQNASEVLAEKINNGVRIEKDGKTLINKKDLAGFMKYACEEARKLAKQGATGACVKDEIVFGWLIHYFEEDSIEGTLLNEDGTPYKVAKKQTQKSVKQTPAPVVQAKPAQNKPAQFTLFDMITENASKQEPKETATIVVDETDYSVDKETGEILPIKEKPKGSGLYQQYMNHVKATPNALVVMRIGDFYEIFGDHAVDIGNKLELTITGRDCGLEERVPMIGFPYHAADNYIRKIREYYNVLLVDGTETKFLPYEDGNGSNFDDYDEDDDELTEEEMREFDGDFDEIISDEKIDEQDDLDDVQYIEYIDKEAFMVLVELLDDKLDVQ
jgi:hypothetical protein